MISAWMSKNGISPQLVNRYKKSNWLEPVGHGVWLRSGSELTWQGAVHALQQQQQMNIYPAATTALQMQGRAHYLPVGKNPTLYLSAANRIPAWFLKQAFAKGLKQLNNLRLFDPVYIGLTEWQGPGYTVKISSPERAMLEYCQLFPEHADFEEAQQLMQGLISLRPTLLQSLLQACRSVKAKRLFLALSESVAQPWYEKLKPDEIFLGKGKRSIMSNGSLHPGFQITVPESWITA